MKGAEIGSLDAGFGANAEMVRIKARLNRGSAEGASVGIAAGVE